MSHLSFNNGIFIFVNDVLGVPPGILTKVAATLLVFLLWQLLVRLFRRFIRRQTEDQARRYIASKFTVYSMRVIAVIVLINIWVGAGGDLLAYLGILSAGLAVALQTPIANFAGWVFLLVGKPFSVGHRIEIGGHKGDVIDIRPTQTTLLEIGNWINAEQSSGRVVHIPNGWFLLKSVANYTQEFAFIWNEIAVTLTFESDWQRGKRILEEILRDHQFISEEDATRMVKEASSEFLLLFRRFTPIIYTTVDPSGVTLTMRYICSPKERRFAQHKLWEAVLISFEKEPNIDFAYPTQRIYMDHPKSTR